MKITLDTSGWSKIQSAYTRTRLSFPLFGGPVGGGAWGWGNGEVGKVKWKGGDFFFLNDLFSFFAFSLSGYHTVSRQSLVFG